MITFKQEEDGRRGKFILLKDDKPIGEMTYVLSGSNKMIIIHTETHEDHAGNGYGKMLVLKGVEYAKEKGLKILPRCPFAKKVMEEDQSLHDMIFDEAP